MSTSSSSPTYPTTQREHSVHHAHLQAHPVAKLRHQESLWREDLQSGGNPRTTTLTGYELKELATISKIDAYSGDPYQFFDVHERFGEEDHQAPNPEETEEFGKIGTAGVPDSELLEKCENHRVLQRYRHRCHCSLSYRRGPFESNGRKQLSLSSCGWVLIRSGQFIITLVAELGIQPLIRSFWTETSAITFSTFSIAVTVFSSSTYGGDWSLSVDGACIIAFSAQCTGL